MVACGHTTDELVVFVLSLQRPLRPALVLVAALSLGTLSLWGSQGAGATQTPDANLLTGDTASLVNGIGAWEGRQAKVSRSSSGVLALSATSTSWSGAASGSSATAVPAVAGRVYTGTLSVRTARTARSVSAVLQFLAQDGTVLGKAFGQSASDGSTAWSATQPVTGVAPQGVVSVVLAEFVSSPAVGEVHYLRLPRLTVAPVRNHDVVGPLHTAGNVIYDANGPVVLKGINRRGLEAANPVPITVAEIAQAKQWGATMVRLPVSSSYWLTSNCNYDSRYANMVDQAVTAITSQNMVALVDLHTNTMVSCGLVRQQKMADSTALDFWRQAATRYRDNPLVAFDLYNEPHDISGDVWLRGGKIMNGTSVVTVVGMQAMYDAVRSTGADNLVMISGLGWAASPPAQLVNGTGIVYAIHDYTCHRTDMSDCTANPLDPTPVLKRWDGLASMVPVAVTEFGYPNQNDGRFNANLLKYAGDRGWSWSAFGWDGVTSGDFSLLASLGATYQPAPGGMPVLAALTPPS
jgi:hypothetical protein